MRGSPDAVHRGILYVGIIPAHAGLTVILVLVLNHVRDHPRACGAHFFITPACESAKGSSPRMRGSLARMTGDPMRIGIIPAHAGLTHRRLARGGICRDHPRACGAHAPAKIQSACATGSSPRMRGSLYSRKVFKLRQGIIPAHAGLTMLYERSLRLRRDHPRACGAHA